MTGKRDLYYEAEYCMVSWPSSVRLSICPSIYLSACASVNSSVSKQIVNEIKNIGFSENLSTFLTNEFI